MRLALTTPHTRGKAVKAAQTLLHKNRFGKDFLGGKVDGEFGTETKRACKRAKFWLGYPTKDITGVYGWRLNEFLTGKKRLPLRYKLRARRRQKQASQVSLGVKALHPAAQQLGVKESPAGSNLVLFSRWYGVRGPWCAMFVSWCFAQVGGKFRYSYVPNIVYDARHGRNGLQVVRVPKPGDLACFDWQRDGTADHVGFVTAWHGGSFDSIEGNTGFGNDSNGGEVMRRSRSAHQVQAFVRVGR